MNGERLKTVFRKLVRLLDASAKDVFIREYAETGGHPESGISPERTPVDTPVVPRPVVCSADAKLDGVRELVTDDMRIVAGDVKVLMDATQDVNEGTVLRYDGSDWHVYRVEKPALFGVVQVVVAYARKIQGGGN